MNAINDFFLQVVMLISLLIGVVMACLVVLGTAVAKSNTIREVGKEAGKQVAKAAVSRAIQKITKL